MKKTAPARANINFVNVNNHFKKLALATALFAGLAASAQNTNLVRYSVADSTIERRLVELAWSGPEMNQQDHQNKIFEYQLKNAKSQWTNLLTISANYNDQTLRGTTNTAYVFPKYFFGLNIPIGTLLNRTPIKSAKEGVEIGKLRQEEMRRKLKADVLGKWKQYKAQSEVIAMETGLMNDIEAALTETRERFRKNEASFEVLNVAQRTRNDEQAKIINLKLQLDITKLEIERIIGVPLETVLK